MFRMGQIAIRCAVLALLLSQAAMVQAFTKCQRPGKVLYTQDLHCPNGFALVPTAAGGTVSTVGKSDSVRQQEHAFLASRSAHISMASPSSVTITNSVAVPPQAAVCEALAEQARTVEASMRRHNPPQWQDTLHQQYRSLRDQQYRLGC
ncbi:hypothetical protein [Cupriavidus sp. H18C2]|uniref:hypothetical protein n=1 Tax=Cupriavidus sp. H18C2 TaxID=3241602 RepID=UPI003BF8FDC1